VLCISLFFCKSLFANSSRPLCSLQLLCEQIKEPSVFFSSFSRREDAPEGFEKIQRIFSESKTAAVRVLQQKKDFLPVKTFHRLFRNLESVRLGRFDEAPARALFSGACNRPNAIYVKSLHKVFVCPSLEGFPEITLFQILSHELGHVVQAMQKSLSCFQKTPRGQLNEAFADWVSSKAVSVKLAEEKDPALAQKSAFESQLLFLSLACPRTSPATGGDWAPTHPSLRARVEETFLSQPAFQNALGCKAKASPSCR